MSLLVSDDGDLMSEPTIDLPVEKSERRAGNDISLCSKSQTRRWTYLELIVYRDEKLENGDENTIEGGLNVGERVEISENGKGRGRKVDGTDEETSLNIPAFIHLQTHPADLGPRSFTLPPTSTRTDHPDSAEIRTSLRQIATTEYLLWEWLFEGVDWGEWGEEDGVGCVCYYSYYD
ncbi:hypothetical protein DFP72DRAFT_1141359 [Ephemerocybe angulata]|uniref:Uncharacterized protein n=1 Tax=Ephemerocybe angulata TaxID=980116 RepID=A0A8H6IFD6_9AGAR|nr:hypothetical protein DFP72DRAFT_1141359 [Tulosesus angulatus]